MNALYLTIPMAMLIALGALIVFLWSLKSGQYEDIEGPKYRMLFDDESNIDKPIPKQKKFNAD
ncbi:cbb3-type cytochrome oxidase assembly protein CcoS [Leptospira mayottensis]|uniref:Cytochrome oxidase maturation protein, cbb3-type n=2 Tax=Leptospira mayottensis TaxID=1137606 RepID=A0AA87SXV0_9LEPT|nr:cbb3-type cytochrome oxidase assembly protein CcoS [Leptospira mayottensis]AXR61587.1 cbb3-type cytochrome oxidase assembly protein CcoS [Leptospira mayottensis]AXR65147.1 cbb3-type cytochrome oxidase assembly protein CcoS [Leptospira mayottensis]AXR69157.1 cbb3-type cytochrome oxidase assembly protein CcoS [Leptospira mayottensis]AZQ01972.1 cbb3-type cytochrome oxidase assembly protein CcoS [Leptospira mayottensis 200901116]EKS01579.1 cytochrome oxidase maturation protein, cbb3-type [Lepto